jgi:hypothetical protein
LAAGSPNPNGEQELCGEGGLGWRSDSAIIRASAAAISETLKQVEEILPDFN